MNPGISIRVGNNSTLTIGTRRTWRDTAGILPTSYRFRTIKGRDRCCYHQCYTAHALLRFEVRFARSTDIVSLPRQPLCPDLHTATKKVSDC
jgi:hypothetical protein